MSEDWQQFTAEYRRSGFGKQRGLWQALDQEQRKFAGTQYGLSPPRRSVWKVLAVVIGVPVIAVGSIALLANLGGNLSVLETILGFAVLIAISWGLWRMRSRPNFPKVRV